MIVTLQLTATRADDTRTSTPETLIRMTVHGSRFTYAWKWVEL